MREENIPVSFDVFGMTFWSHDDYNIGQRLIDVLPYADFVSPMVYPSHYVDGFKGYANPAEYPYEIVKQSLDEGLRLMHGFFAGSDAELAALPPPGSRTSTSAPSIQVVTSKRKFRPPATPAPAVGSSGTRETCMNRHSIFQIEKSCIIRACTAPSPKKRFTNISSVPTGFILIRTPVNSGRMNS